MKRHVAVTALSLAVALSAVFAAGCGTTGDSGDSGDNSAGNSANESTENSGEDSAQNSDNDPDSVPEKQTPDGEPTFLIAPDGEPIYTSEITQFCNYSRESHIELVPDGEGSLENFTAARCDGFVYGYIPEKGINFVENPELFSFHTDNTEYRYYEGEEYPPSTEYVKIYEGDKFGTLTVSRAYSVFSGEYRDISESEKEIPGAYYAGGYLELDGEIELTGYMRVEVDGWYDKEGDLYFFPDSSSSSKIPNINCYWDREGHKLYHECSSSFYGYYGDYYWVGNMNDYDIDFDGLRPGDDFVKVKVTLGDINIDIHDMLYRFSSFSLKSVERIKE